MIFNVSNPRDSSQPPRESPLQSSHIVTSKPWANKSLQKEIIAGSSIIQCLTTTRSGKLEELAHATQAIRHPDARVTLDSLVATRGARGYRGLRGGVPWMRFSGQKSDNLIGVMSNHYEQPMDSDVSLTAIHDRPVACPWVDLMIEQAAPATLTPLRRRCASPCSPNPAAGVGQRLPRVRAAVAWCRAGRGLHWFGGHAARTQESDRGCRGPPPPRGRCARFWWSPPPAPPASPWIRPARG